MSEVNKINFLLKAAALLPPTGHINQVLKAHYLTTSRQLAKNNVNLPQSEFGVNRICQKCSACWIDGNYKMKVISTRIERTKQKKLLQKLEAGEFLTKKQKIRAKWLKKKKTSFVEVKCLLCGNKSKFHLNKPPKEDTIKVAEVTTNEILTEEPILKKKSTKKKRKDKFVGLNPALVQMASTSTSTSNHQQSISNTAIPSTSQQSHKSATIVNKKTEQKLLSTTTLNIKKSENKIKTKNQPSKEITSKIKQKNTFMQLANLLKTNNNSTNSKSSTNNRLENLLRQN